MIPYEPDFYTKAEADELFAFCKSLPHDRKKNKPWGNLKRRLSFPGWSIPYETTRSSYDNMTYDIDAMPQPYQGLRNRLSAYAGKDGGAAGSNFNPKMDLLGLIVGVIGSQTLQEWRGLQKQDVTTTPERMVQRLADSQQSSASQRAIFESFRRPLNGVIPDSLETARLVSRIRVLPFLEDKEGDCINLCAEIVVDGSLDEGLKLWSRLLQLAAENRGTGGYFDLSKLVRTLRPDFELRDYPDFDADWKRLGALSSDNVNAVRRILGSGIQLDRTSEGASIASEIAGHNTIAIVGESGSGKFALVSRLVGTSGAFRRVLWLRAEELSKTSQTELTLALNLRHNIPVLIQ